MHLDNIVSIIKFYTKKIFKFFLSLFGFCIYRHSSYEYILTRDLPRSQANFQSENIINDLELLTNNHFKEFLFNNSNLLQQGLEVAKTKYFFENRGVVFS